METQMVHANKMKKTNAGAHTRASSLFWHFEYINAEEKKNKWQHSRYHANFRITSWLIKYYHTKIRMESLRFVLYRIEVSELPLRKLCAHKTDTENENENGKAPAQNTGNTVIMLGRLRHYPNLYVLVYQLMRVCACLWWYSAKATCFGVEVLTFFIHFGKDEEFSH